MIARLLGALTTRCTPCQKPAGRNRIGWEASTGLIIWFNASHAGCLAKWNLAVKDGEVYHLHWDHEDEAD